MEGINPAGLGLNITSKGSQSYIRSFFFNDFRSGVLSVLSEGVAFSVCEIIWGGLRSFELMSIFSVP